MKFVLMSAFFVLMLALQGCDTTGSQYAPVTPQLIQRMASQPTYPIVTTFEDICLNHSPSFDDMLNAAKKYNLVDAPIKTKTTKGRTISSYWAHSQDKIINVILRSNGDCSVRYSTGKSIAEAMLLLSDDYGELGKTIDLQLGMLLMKKYGAENILTSRVVKDVNSSTYNRTIFYGPSYSRISDGKIVTYNLSPSAVANRIDLTYD